MDIAELLAFSVKNKASDLHLSAGLPPMIRVDGDVRRINIPPLEHKTVHGLIYDIMNDKQRKDYEEFLETDFSFEVPGVARFRVNAFNQNRGAGAVFRTIPSKILTLEQLNELERLFAASAVTKGGIDAVLQTEPAVTWSVTLLVDADRRDVGGPRDRLGQGLAPRPAGSAALPRLDEVDDEDQGRVRRHGAVRRALRAVRGHRVGRATGRGGRCAAAHRRAPPGAAGRSCRGRGQDGPPPCAGR